MSDRTLVGPMGKPAKKAKKKPYRGRYRRYKKPQPQPQPQPQIVPVNPLDPVQLATVTKPTTLPKDAPKSAQQLRPIPKYIPPVVEAKVAEPAYQLVKAAGYTLTVNEQAAAIPGQIICTGAYTRLVNQVDFGTICSLSDFFFPRDQPGLFSDKYAADDVFQRTRNFLEAHRETVLTKKYFIAAINKAKPGGKKDLPNVNAAVVSWLLEHLPHDTVFMDPIDFLRNPYILTSDSPLKLTNFTKVVQHIQERLAYPIPMDTSANGKDTSATIISYQRGQGVPRHAERQQIIAAVDDTGASFINVQLAPGKYDYRGATAGMPKMCYKEFAPSVAQLVNQFTDFREYLKFSDKRAVRQMFLVMDEFSGYSMFTVAALKGFGLDKITTVLCYYHGNYSHAIL